MANAYLALKTISRSRGQSAVASAVYRCGIEAEDERTGEWHDYTTRSGVVSVDLIGWDGTVAELANAMEAAERRGDSVVAREVILALPAEATRAERRALVQAFGQWLRERHGVAIIAAIHKPSRTGDNRNHHAHLMLTTRRVEGRTLGLKTRELDTAKTGSGHLEAWRGQWGQMLGLDMRSYARQGVDREAEPKLPTAAARAQWRAVEKDRQRLPELGAELGQVQRQIDATKRRSVPVRPRTQPAMGSPGRHPLSMGLRLDQIAYERRVRPAAPEPAPAVPWAERVKQWQALHRPSPTPLKRVNDESTDNRRDRGRAGSHVQTATERSGLRSQQDWADFGPNRMG